MTAPTDLSNLKTALEAIVTPVGYPPVKRVYAFPTEKEVTTAELPCIMIMWGAPPKTTMFTFKTEREDRQYLIKFFYKPIGQGTLNDNMNDILQYRDALKDALYAHQQLFSTVVGQYPIQCGLPVELPDTWNGQKYYGFSTTINTIVERAITIGV